MLLYQDFAADGRQLPLEEIGPATPGEYLGAGIKQTWELNPSTQALRLGELSGLEPRQPYTDEMGMPHETPGLAPDDPRARRMSVDEANELGKDDGLRFSEPPTQAQFDYLRDLKRAENQRMQVLSQAPGLGTQAVGFLADLAASAVDPLNIVTSFVPIVGQARYAGMVSRLGTGGARAAKGAIEGAAGAAMVDPIIYAQAQALQQEFTLSDAMMDVVLGAGLGSGLHWGGGKIADKVRERKAKATQARMMSELDAYYKARWGGEDVVDWRTVKFSYGENPHVVEAMRAEDRARTLNAAVKAVESDQVPRMDELLKAVPEARPLAMPDPKYPATLRLRSTLTAADFRPGNPAADLLEQHLYATVPNAKRDDPGLSHLHLFQTYTRAYTKFAKSGWTLATVSRAQFDTIADKSLLEFPEQQVYVDPEKKTILASSEAMLSAVRHEIERALDLVQGYRGEQAGGYRYRRSDVDGPNVHRKAIAALGAADPARKVAPQAAPEQAVDLFARQAEPIMRPDETASSAAFERMTTRKDMDLDTLMKEEEIIVLEDSLRHTQNSARAAGIIEKVIPIEERELFDVAAVNASGQKLAKTLETEVQQAVDEGRPDAELLNTVRAAFDADPEILRRWMRGEISDDEFDRLAAAGRPLPEKTPEEGAGTAQETSGEPKAETEDDLLADMEEQVLAILEGMTPLDATDIEARVLAKEQQLLSGDPSVRDLHRSEEHQEFNEANSERAQREGAGADGAGGGAVAGAQPAPQALEDGLPATAVGGDGKPLPGAGAIIDAERGASGGDRSASETTRSIGWGAIPSRVITPDGRIEVGVEPVIVEHSSLRRAEGAYQPRDRSRKESDANIRERANHLDPEQLMPTRVSDSGPPIVTKDGMVISGNGRFATIGMVYRDITLTTQAQRYRERLGPAADGYKQPILVMRITDDLSEEDLIKFADRSNRGRIESMSATEKAQRDVRSAGMDLMQLYQGGDFERRENREFLQGFMRRVATTTELGEMSKNGRLTKEGYDRLNAAVLAAAYDDAGVLSIMLESADDNIRSITSAYRDVAPAFMKLRAEIAAGVVREEMDLTPYMMQAARMISEQRAKGVKIADFLAQQDAFNPLDPAVEALIRSYYNKELTRAASALRIQEFLRFYAEEARKHQAGGFLPDETTIGDVLAVAKKSSQKEIPLDGSDQTGLLAASEDAGLGTAPERQAAPEPTAAGAGGQAGAGVGDASVSRGTARVELKTRSKSDISQTITVRRDGKDIAEIVVSTKEGDDLVIQNVKALSGKPVNALGAATIRAIKAELAALFPERKAITGKRVSGARRAAGAVDDAAVPLQPRPIDTEPPLPVRTMKTASPAAAKRAEALRVLAGEARETQIRKYGNALKKADLEMTAEAYLGRPLEAKERKTKATILAAMGAQPAAPKTTATDIPAKTQDYIDRLEQTRGTDAFLRVYNAMVADRSMTTLEINRVANAFVSETPASAPRARSLQRILSRHENTVDARQKDAVLTGLAQGVEAGKARAVELGVAPAAPGMDIVTMRERMRDLDPHFLGKKGILRWKAWREADTKLRSDILGGLSPEEAQARLGPHLKEGEEIIAMHDADRAEDAEEIASKPVRAEPTREQRTMPNKEKFYDFLEGTAPVKNIRTVAKALGIQQSEAAMLLDHAVENGWLKLKDDGTYIRVPKTKRPVRPGADDFSAPAGWGNIDGGTEIANVNEAVIRATEREAIRIIAEAERLTPQQVRQEFGLAQDRDYVRLAQREHGFQPIEGYFNALARRDLQASLVSMKVLSEAARILPPVVRVQMVDAIYFPGGGFARGVFRSDKRVVQMARTWDERQAIDTMHHETIHALRNLRLFTKQEWKILTDTALAERWLSPEKVKRYLAHYEKSAQEIFRMDPERRITEEEVLDRLMEEAVATRYGNWARENRGKMETETDFLFDRIRRFFAELFKAAKAYFKAPTVGEIFQAIHDGKIGERWADWNGGRIDDNARNSARSFAIADHAEMINTDLKALALDDSEKIGSLSARALEALAPCAAYHL